MRRVPAPTFIYHITHLRNLRGIVEYGGLFCTNSLRRTDRNHRSIAHESIQDRRETIDVGYSRGGTLHDYVPFYFAPRAPMLYAIHKGNVPNCPEGQQPIVHLVSEVQKLVEAGLRFVFTDGHGIMALTNFYEDLSNLDAVDWELMNAQYWADTDDDPDRSRRRQAEFLVHDFFPWNLVTEIGVFSDKVKRQVETIGSSLSVRTRRAWYY